MIAPAAAISVQGCDAPCIFYQCFRQPRKDQSTARERWLCFNRFFGLGDVSL